jgi:hypothetical protein
VAPFFLKVLSKFPSCESADADVVNKRAVKKSGTYIYTLIVDGKKIDSKQMIIAK